MKRRGGFGSSYRSLGGFRLGAIDAAQQGVLVSNADALWSYLDAVGARINDAATAGVGDDVLTHLRQERDTMRADLQRLSDRVSVLNTQDDIGAWQGAYDQLRARAVELNAQVEGMLGQARSSQLRTVGLWAGGATLGVVGLVLLVRWYGSRRRRGRR